MSAAATKKPLLIGPIAERSLLVALMRNRPIIEASTPIPITTSGNVIPRAAGLRMLVNPKFPRMRLATRITP